MIDWYDQGRCVQARGYFLDYVEPASRWSIPPAILTHLATCPACQGQVRRLAEMMDDSARPGSAGAQDQRDAVMVDLLKHHFAYLDKPVVCSGVRPFLPSLADPGLGIRIATPITAHLNRCEACAADMATLRRYGLTGGQLHRLSRFFLGGRSAGASPLCQEVAKVISVVASCCLDEVSPEVLTHVCVCPACRDRVVRHRAWLQTDLEGSGGRDEKGGLCETVSTADLFDYVLPYKLDFQADPRARFRRSLSEHLGRCSRCLARIQQMHRQVVAMACRPDSGVTTYYCIPTVSADQGQEAVVVDSHGAECGPSGERIPPALAHEGKSADMGRVRGSTGRPRLWPRAAVAAAAVLILAGALVYLIPTATAVPVTAVFQSLGRARAVHIAVHAAEGPRLVQEFWLDRDRGLCLMRQQDVIVLWDLAGRVQRLVEPKDGVVRTESLSGEKLVRVKGLVDTAFGTLPFDSPRSVPASAQWGTLDSDMESRGNRDVYELRWTERLGPERELRRKWRVYVDSQSNLPRRAEYYSKLGTETDYGLQTTVTIEYVTGDQIQAVLAALIPQ